MFIDIIIGISLIIFTLLGLRDGFVRKLVACIALIIGLFLGHFYMHKVGLFLIDNSSINPLNAPVYGFLIIFMSIAILQGLLYRILTGGYKIKGIADRIAGTFFGFLEGVLFLSSILYILALSGTPSRATTHDSKFYKTTVNIAPQILDFASTLGPDAIEKLKDIGTSGATEEKDKKKAIYQSTDTAAALSKKRQIDVLEQARKSVRK